MASSLCSIGSHGGLPLAWNRLLLSFWSGVRHPLWVRLSWRTSFPFPNPIPFLKKLGERIFALEYRRVKVWERGYSHHRHIFFPCSPHFVLLVPQWEKELLNDIPPRPSNTSRSVGMTYSFTSGTIFFRGAVAGVAGAVCIDI